MRPSDVSEIVRLQKELHKKRGMEYLGEFVYEDARESITQMIARPDLIGLVAQQDGKLVGTMGLIVVPQLFNKSKLVASEIAWAVDETVKGLGAAMVEAARAVLKRRGVHGLFYYAKGGHKALNRYYRMKGHKEVETTYYEEF